MKYVASEKLEPNDPIILDGEPYMEDGQIVQRVKRLPLPDGDPRKAIRELAEGVKPADPDPR